MRETPAQSLEHLPLHSVHCPNCQEKFDVQFGKFGHSNYHFVGCDHCANLIALNDLDPVILYLDGKFSGNEQEIQNCISKALMTCPCGGKFRTFDDRRRCPLCKVAMKEIQMSAQVPGMGPEMRPIPGKLFFMGRESWAHLEFLHPEIETAAREYESNPSLGGSPDSSQLWLAKEIFDVYFRKITSAKLERLVPDRGDLFFFNHRVYHNHGGAFGPWWKFWDRELMYPERCGMVFDIDQKQFKCASCKQSFETAAR